MVWLEKLKSLFNIDINSPLISVNIHSNNNSVREDFLYDREKGSLEIYLEKLRLGKREEVDRLIEEYYREKEILLEKNSSKLLHKLYRYNRENKGNQTLNFFKLLIPKEDFEALEVSMYLRDVYSRGEEIARLKQDITRRFGDRGNNISNLCTAGYFEEFLMPLYNSSKERFEELYEFVISKSVVAVFVHSGMKQDQIPSEISNRLQISVRYGLKFIHIHGIGKHNISVIKRSLEEQQNFFEFFQKEVYEKDNIIIVELLLK